MNKKSVMTQSDQVFWLLFVILLGSLIGTVVATALKLYQ